MTTICITIMTVISRSHLGLTGRLEGFRLTFPLMTNPNLSLFYVWSVEASSWDLCCSFCRSSWKWKSWISGGIRTGIWNGMLTPVVGSRRAVVLMAMTRTMPTPHTTIITHISRSHLGPPYRLDGVRISFPVLTNPNLSLFMYGVWRPPHGISVVAL